MKWLRKRSGLQFDIALMAVVANLLLAFSCCLPGAGHGLSGLDDSTWCSTVSLEDARQGASATAADKAAAHACECLAACAAVSALAAKITLPDFTPDLAPAFGALALAALGYAFLSRGGPGNRAPPYAL